MDTPDSNSQPFLELGLPSMSCDYHHRVLIGPTSCQPWGPILDKFGLCY